MNHDYTTSPAQIQTVP